MLLILDVTETLEANFGKLKTMNVINTSTKIAEQVCIILGVCVRVTGGGNFSFVFIERMPKMILKLHLNF